VTGRSHRSRKDGTVENLLIVLESGAGSLPFAALAPETRWNWSTLSIRPPGHYRDRLSQEPSWKITAARVTRDGTAGRIRFASGRLTILGVTVPLLPVFSIGDGSQNGSFSGAMVPGIRLDSNNGLELNLPYYWRLDRNRDLTVTPHIYTGSLPALEARWRHLTSIGAYQLGAFVTYGNIPDPDQVDLTPTDRRGSAVISKAMGASSSIPTGL
jgi:LPS-assembly protein